MSFCDFRVKEKGLETDLYGKGLETKGTPRTDRNRRRRHPIPAGAWPQSGFIPVIGSGPQLHGGVAGPAVQGVREGGGRGQAAWGDRPSAMDELLASGGIWGLGFLGGYGGILVSGWDSARTLARSLGGSSGWGAAPEVCFGSEGRPCGEN